MSPLIKHALVLHLYQPPGNLQQMLQHNEDELQRILLCYERIARHARKYADVARVHIVFSVPLLQQLRAPDFIDGCRHMVDIPAILEAFRSAPNIEFIASGYQHAPLPLIPHDDWDEQLRGERGITEEVLGHVPRGYWPPASLFSVDMVPTLVAAGFEYVLLSNSVLVSKDDQTVDPYRTYRLSHQGYSITVVPCDAGFSQAQEHGLDAPWLADELLNGISQSPASANPYLMTSCSDGENGEWFRRLDEEQGFFGHFFSPYMEFCETGEFPIRPENLSHFIHSYPAKHTVNLRKDVSLASPGMPESVVHTAALDRMGKVSQRYWSLIRGGKEVTSPINRKALAQARELLLQAQGSCYLLGQEDQLEDMLVLLEQAEALLGIKQVTPAVKPRVKTDNVARKLSDSTKMASMLKVAEKSAADSKAPLAKPKKVEKQVREAADSKSPVEDGGVQVPANDRSVQNKPNKQPRVVVKTAKQNPTQVRPENASDKGNQSLGAKASPEPVTPDVDKTDQKSGNSTEKKPVTTPRHKKAQKKRPARAKRRTRPARKK